MEPRDKEKTQILKMPLEPLDPAKPERNLHWAFLLREPQICFFIKPLRIVFLSFAADGVAASTRILVNLFFGWGN